MQRARLIVLAAIALLIAQLQCVATCVDQFCGAGSAQSQSVPPCHRQHKQSPAPVTCPDQILTTATSVHALPAGVAMMPALALAHNVSASFPRVAQEPVDPSPPGIGTLYAIVLRI